MVTYRTHSIEFKRQVVQEFLSGDAAWSRQAARTAA